MTAVKELTTHNRTAISTIHQPSPEVFALFDKLVLLSAGRLIFFGNANDAPKMFTTPELGEPDSTAVSPLNLAPLSHPLSTLLSLLPGIICTD